MISGGHETLRAARAVLIEMTTRSHYVNDHLAEELHDRLGELGYRRVATSEPWLDAHGDPLWYDACYVNGGRSNG